MSATDRNITGGPGYIPPSPPVKPGKIEDKKIETTPTDAGEVPTKEESAKKSDQVGLKNLAGNVASHALEPPLTQAIEKKTMTTKMGPTVGKGMTSAGVGGITAPLGVAVSGPWETQREQKLKILNMASDITTQIEEKNMQELRANIDINKKAAEETLDHFNEIEKIAEQLESANPEDAPKLLQQIGEEMHGMMDSSIKLVADPNTQDLVEPKRVVDGVWYLLTGEKHVTERPKDQYSREPVGVVENMWYYLTGEKPLTEPVTPTKEDVKDTSIKSDQEKQEAKRQEKQEAIRQEKQKAIQQWKERSRNSIQKCLKDLDIKSDELFAKGKAKFETRKGEIKGAIAEAQQDLQDKPPPGRLLAMGEASALQIATWLTSGFCAAAASVASHSQPGAVAAAVLPTTAAGLLAVGETHGLEAATAMKTDLQGMPVKDQPKTIASRASNILLSGLGPAVWLAMFPTRVWTSVGVGVLTDALVNTVFPVVPTDEELKQLARMCWDTLNKMSAEPFRNDSLELLKAICADYPDEKVRAELLSYCDKLEERLKAQAAEEAAKQVALFKATMEAKEAKEARENTITATKFVSGILLHYWIHKSKALPKLGEAIEKQYSDYKEAKKAKAGKGETIAETEASKRETIAEAEANEAKMRKIVEEGFGEAQKMNAYEKELKNTLRTELNNPKYKFTTENPKGNPYITNRDAWATKSRQLEHLTALSNKCRNIVEISGLTVAEDAEYFDITKQIIDDQIKSLSEEMGALDQAAKDLTNEKMEYLRDQAGKQQPATAEKIEPERVRAYNEPKLIDKHKVDIFEMQQAEKNLQEYYNTGSKIKQVSRFFKFRRPQTEVMVFTKRPTDVMVMPESRITEATERTTDVMVRPEYGTTEATENIPEPKSTTEGKIPEPKSTTEGKIPEPKTELKGKVKPMDIVRDNTAKGFRQAAQAAKKGKGGGPAGIFILSSTLLYDSVSRIYKGTTTQKEKLPEVTPREYRTRDPFSEKTWESDTESKTEEKVTESKIEEQVTEPKKEELVTESKKEELVTESKKEEQVIEPKKEEQVAESREEPVKEENQTETKTEQTWFDRYWDELNETGLNV